MKIRPAEPEDIDLLERLFEEFSGWKVRRSESILRAIADSMGEFLVAEADNKIVGFIHQVFFEDPLHGGTNSLITDLFVRDAYRERGIGSQLLRRMLEAAKAREVKEVHVTTREDNAYAIKFYENHGFNKAGILLENDFVET